MESELPKETSTDPLPNEAFGQTGGELRRYKKNRAGFGTTDEDRRAQTQFFFVNVCSFPSGNVKVKRRVKFPFKRSRNPLSCLKATKSTKKEKIRPGWGLPFKPSKYRTNSYDKVYEAATTLEKLFPKHELLYVVVTLPGSTEESKEAFEDYCAYFSSRMIRYIRKVIARPLYIKVWEYQKRSALHFNLFLHVPYAARNAICQQRIKNECGRIFRSIGSFRNIDMFEAVDGSSWSDEDSQWRIECSPLRSSLANYLAKKHSKQPRTRHDGTIVSPGRWFDISAGLRALVKKETVQATVLVNSEEQQLEIEQTLVELLAKDGSVREICNPISGIQIGVSFTVNDLNEMRDAVRLLSE